MPNNGDLFFPTIIVNDPNVKSENKIKYEDLAISYFAKFGFESDKSRKNLYGYHGLFRELASPPPWINVEHEDIFSTVSEHRMKQLEPLYVQASKKSCDCLVKTYKEHLSQKQSALEKAGIIQNKAIVKNMFELQKKALRSKIMLAKTLGRNRFEEIYESIFEFDEFTHAEGCPDIFAWDSDNQMWFFSEVKGPGDYISPSQANWIRRNWSRIEGCFIYLLFAK